MNKESTYILHPTNYKYIIKDHFPELTLGKKIGLMGSGGMESTLIGKIAQELYGKENVILFYDDSIFSNNQEDLNDFIKSNIDKAEKLLGSKSHYIGLDFQTHKSNKKKSVDELIEKLTTEYNVEYILWGFTELFFEVEVFRQDGITREQVKQIAYADPVKYKATIEEFHLDTEYYIDHLLNIGIDPDVYPLLRGDTNIMRSPFKDINKPEVVDLYNQLGWLDVLRDTNSCILEINNHCGYCFNCQQRYDAFRIHGKIEDTTEYRQPDIKRRRKHLEEVRNANS